MPLTQPATQPAIPAADQTPIENPASAEKSPLLPQAADWTRAEALARLADQEAALSAAVRLVRLAEESPLCVPDPLPADLARRLGVVRLSEFWYALGRCDDQAKRIFSAVLIAADGHVTLPVKGIEEELSALYVASDPEVFPHLLITPVRILIIGEQVRSAIVARELAGLRFEWIANEGYPFVALRHRPADADPFEVARYVWDPYELAFMGPVADKLPDPPGGMFELNLEACEALIPVGGVLPELPELEEQEQPDDGRPIWEEPA